jgi:hypothetical protein
MKGRNFALMFALALASCSVDKFPLPDEFDAAFATGQVCAPTNVGTAAGAATYPVRFDLCVYRCITLDRSTTQVRSFYSCSAGVCQMMYLATAHAITDQTQQDCDGRDLVDPPSDECRLERFDFNLSFPDFNGERVDGNFLVTIPFLELDQGQRVIDRLQAGEDPHTVISEEVGVQNYPMRQFNMSFDAAHPTITTHDQLTAADCHDIEAP